MLGLLERNTGKAASDWLEIPDSVSALDLELAITYRLFKFDNDVMESNAILIANKVGMLFGDKEEADYEDSSAEVW